MHLSRSTITLAQELYGIENYTFTVENCTTYAIPYKYAGQYCPVRHLVQPSIPINGVHLPCISPLATRAPLQKRPRFCFSWFGNSHENCVAVCEFGGFYLVRTVGESDVGCRLIGRCIVFVCLGVVANPQLEHATLLLIDQKLK